LISCFLAIPDDLLGEDGLFKQLKKALIERALGAELTEHLGYERGDPAAAAATTAFGKWRDRRLCYDGHSSVSLRRSASQSPFRNPSSKACLPTSRSSAAIRASYAWIMSAAAAS
jgi:hypothetical protein